MGVLFLTDVRCRKCEHSIDTHLSGVCTKLGPAKIRCPKCSAIIHTGRTEWHAFSAGRKVWYVALTIAGAVVLGFLGGVGIRGAVHYTEAGPWVHQMDLGAGFRSGAVGWAVGVVALQCIRVPLSIRRAAQGGTKARKVIRVANITFDLQLKLLAAVWVPTMLAWVVSYLRSR